MKVPQPVPNQHSFEHVWVHKATAKEQIDAAMAKGFDFYFNFMWGQYEDEVAGVAACQYFESLGGAPKVPGILNYPLFIKPAISCASLFISEKPLCANREELRASLQSLCQELEPRRKMSGRTLENLNSSLVVDGIPIPDDIVVQKFIPGWDHSVVIIELGDRPVPLNPERYVHSDGYNIYSDFLRFDVKFDPRTHVELVPFEETPELFRKLQDGEPTVLEVTPMPAIFLTPEIEWEDIVIRNSFPGGHRALIDVLIANELDRQNRDKEREARVAKVYDAYSDTYDDDIKHLNLEAIYRNVIDGSRLSGTILELGPGTGLFGRLLSEKTKTPRSHCEDPSCTYHRTTDISLNGIELSQGMIDRCLKTGAYSTVHNGPCQVILPSVRSFDHAVSVSNLCYLSPTDFSLVMPSPSGMEVVKKFLGVRMAVSKDRN
ncbi:hypothetical protein EYZ11_011775 [Aspergillus tanneri]|uniref:Methyltransferase domain-containing protein n=1 Tax=Aspergillus tanneri TaxID=1220188 RepID=A0A4S3J203_9EURO|nr:hypothetical protein EYZ11_011775 [Aspergillus tanneri]